MPQSHEQEHPHFIFVEVMRNILFINQICYIYLILADSFI